MQQIKKEFKTITSILGTSYTIYFKMEEDDEDLKINGGYCDSYNKKIVIKIKSGVTKNWYERVLTHELIHAFLYESGSVEYQNEELVDWVALQFSKIYKEQNKINLDLNWLYCDSTQKVNLEKNYKKIINVLGTPYSLIFRFEKDDIKLENQSSYCDIFNKQIVIRIQRYNCSKEDLKEHWYRRIIINELIYAFLFESGLSCECPWADNSDLRFLIALQFMKIYEVRSKIKLDNKLLYSN